jgi:hypothetical protein
MTPIVVWRHVLVAGATVGLILALGACGAADSQPGVATAGDAQPSTSASSGLVEQYVEGMRSYAKCMREAGFTTPDPDTKGHIDYGTDFGKLKSDPKFQAATKECEKGVPPIPAELTALPPYTAEQIAHQREYAKCVRANGYPEFADPGPNGFEPSRTARPDGPGSLMTEREIKARKFCDPVLDGLPPAVPDPNVTGVG